ncbi:granulocyte-macrophage colony-stimulating factor receptor subunit alpha isoform X1 [Gadus morhua]|uniref:granulocyte-macrophage colony-stimulating factor receptor subunit alpha isoform X1 n=1 Tax=Gadus morhua TaxID=8049 RepID=UPI0011B65875|nr:granulocyte-macrophage colony-stimulating factor receptor subunit alpha-like isoform X1 [Gadus morhua]XP_030219521.1 granulocyte-macrophage colony-stimulating factor receptor subunit alpha-like isoform X1 [Gadus morhua]
MIVKLLGFWLLPSFLWALQTPQISGTPHSDQELCQEYEPTLHRYNSLTRQMDLVKAKGAGNVSCLIYPEKMLRCTVSGQYLPRGSQLSVAVIISDVEEMTSTLPECSEAIQPSKGPGDSKPFVECRVDHPFSSLTVLLNASGPDTHALFCHTFSSELLEVLSPPPNITAEVKEGQLLVSWGLPYSLHTKKHRCFVYQVDDKQEINDIQETTHLERQVDPAAGYAVRIRTRKSPSCLGPEEWSAWSEPIGLPGGSRYNLNKVLIGSILLGTPMIVLALLLLLRKHRVSKLLFPQIPQLPKKYKHFLKRPTSSTFLPVVQAVYEEDITVVEDTQSSTDELKQDL